MPDEQQQLSTRRAMIGKGGALLGTCLLAGASIPAKAQTVSANSTEPIDVRKFGASGKRSDNATRAFRNALKAAAAKGGGTVNVPPGEYTVGNVQLKDNVTLNIEGGATLFLSQVKEDFREDVRTMIYAENAKNIAVTGRGTLDGLAQYDFAEMGGVDRQGKKNGNDATIVLDGTTDGVIRNSKATEGTNTFVFVKGDPKNYVSFKDNETRKAKRAISYEKEIKK